MTEDQLITKAPTNGGASKTGSGEPRGRPEDASGEAAEKPPDAKSVGSPPSPDQPGPVGEQNDLVRVIRQRQSEFLGHLAEPSWLRKVWREFWKPSPPELLKVYGVVYNYLGEAQRLLTERAADPPEGFERIERRLRDMLDHDYKYSRSVNIHAAWEFAGALERALLLLGDEEYLRTRLENEREREQKKLPGSWSEYLAVEKLDELLAGYKAGGGRGLRACAVESLAFLSVRRSAFERTRRAREEVKAGYLNRLTFVLTLLLLILLEVIYIASAEGAGRFSQSLSGFVKMVATLDFKLDLSSAVVRSALVAAMTGALGSTLSGFYKLRDESGGIATLRSFRSAMWAQPFVGATVGVLLMLLIMSGVLAIGTVGEKPKPEWLSLAVYCFFAGFSEPFFLGVVQRVAGAAEKKSAPAAPADAPAKADKRTP